MRLILVSPFYHNSWPLEMSIKWSRFLILAILTIIFMNIYRSIVYHNFSVIIIGIIQKWCYVKCYVTQSEELQLYHNIENHAKNKICMTCGFWFVTLRVQVVCERSKIVINTTFGERLCNKSSITSCKVWRSSKISCKSPKTLFLKVHSQETICMVSLERFCTCHPSLL